MHQNPTLDSLVDILVLGSKMIFEVSGILCKKSNKKVKTETQKLPNLGVLLLLGMVGLWNILIPNYGLLRSFKKKKSLI